MVNFEYEYKTLVNLVAAYAETVNKSLTQLGGSPEKDLVVLKECMRIFIKKVRDQLTKIKEKVENDGTLGNEPANAGN